MQNTKKIQQFQKQLKKWETIRAGIHAEMQAPKEKLKPLTKELRQVNVNIANIKFKLRKEI